MLDKQQLLSLIATGLQHGIITPQDLSGFIPIQPPTPASIALAGASAPPEQPVTAQISGPRTNEQDFKLNPVSLLYYSAGIILFAALMTLLSQIWNETNFFIHLLCTLGVGVLFWTAAYMLGKKPTTGDAKKGITDMLLLTGSLCILASVGAVFTKLPDASNTISNALIISVVLALIGAFNLFFDRIVHHIIPVVFGTLVLSGSLVPVSFALVAQIGGPPDAYAIVMFAAAGLLYASGVYASSTAPNRAFIYKSYATLAVFVILATIYVMCFASTVSTLLWQLILVCAIYAVFYLSIKRRSKEFLASGTLFLVIGSISLSFRYFSGAGAAVSLIIAAISILTSAFIANSINKKYIKA